MDHPDEALYDKIEAYLRGRMTAAETQVFENEVAADPALAEMVQLHRFEREVHELTVRDNIQDQYRRWKNRRKRREKWLKAAITALLLLLVAVAICFFPKKRQSDPIPPAGIPGLNPPHTPETPSSKQDQAAPTEEKKSTPTTPAQPRLASAENLALEAYRQTRRPDDQQRGPAGPAASDTLSLEAQAHDLFKKGRYDEAAERFRRLAAGSGQPAAVQEEMEWYWLLSRVAHHPQYQTETHQIFERLRRRGGDYAAAAARLQEDLSKLPR